MKIVEMSLFMLAARFRMKSVGETQLWQSFHLKMHPFSVIMYLRHQGWSDDLWKSGDNASQTSCRVFISQWKEHNAKLSFDTKSKWITHYGFPAHSSFQRFALNGCFNELRYQDILRNWLWHIFIRADI